jgi:hypothetical protein
MKNKKANIPKYAIIITALVYQMAQMNSRLTREK